jgi:hypothetical protein
MLKDSSNAPATTEEQDATKSSISLSLSPNELSSNALGNAQKHRGERNKKKTENLHILVSQTCKNKIKTEMTNLRSEINDAITANFATLTATITQPVQKSTILSPFKETSKFKLCKLVILR